MLAKRFQAIGYKSVAFDCFPNDSFDHILSLAPDCIFLASTKDSFEDDICCIESLRSYSWEVPFIHLIEHLHYSFFVQSFKAGSDDVLPFSCACEEVDARFNSLMRRLKPNTMSSSSKLIQFEDLQLHLDTREVVRGGVVSKLTVKELELFLLFLRNPLQTLKREAILYSVWGDSWSGDSRLLDVYIGYLRKKLFRDGLPTIIHTVRNVGYVLR
ncbi:response regulator transcription factor [Synechococcus sp. AH-229-G18]|nr:response regulator transcription factor [Synechococcus sp. AH-229-G18]